MSMPEAKDELIPTRWSLLSRLKNWEDQASWQDFFDTYWRLIYAIALRSGLEAAVAEDVVQDTVLTVAKNIGQFRADPAAGSFKSWLRQIVRWRIADHWRKQRRQPILGSAMDDSTATTPGGERLADPATPALDLLWEKEWEQHLLAAALDRVRRQVSPKQYQVFDLYCLKGWPVREVAKTLRVFAGQVYLAKHRVGGLVKKEIKRLERHGY